uniref:Uncharacterized protein n=1 Tax=Parascaris equorum TaxID=6256 RepID=A0A914S183_PAREQ
MHFRGLSLQFHLSKISQMRGILLHLVLVSQISLKGPELILF